MVSHMQPRKHRTPGLDSGNALAQEKGWAARSGTPVTGRRAHCSGTQVLDASAQGCFRALIRHIFRSQTRSLLQHSGAAAQLGHKEQGS